MDLRSSFLYRPRAPSPHIQNDPNASGNFPPNCSTARERHPLLSKTTRTRLVISLPIAHLPGLSLGDIRLYLYLMLPMDVTVDNEILFYTISCV